MPLTAAQIRGAVTSNPWTKDFRHLQPFPLSHLKRYSFKDILVKAAKPKDRIKYWNIVPGDRVRILGDKEGKVLEVAKINKISNRIYLKGATVKVCSPFSFLLALELTFGLHAQSKDRTRRRSEKHPLFAMPAIHWRL